MPRVFSLGWPGDATTLLQFEEREKGKCLFGGEVTNPAEDKLSWRCCGLVQDVQRSMRQPRESIREKKAQEGPGHTMCPLEMAMGQSPGTLMRMGSLLGKGKNKSAVITGHQAKCNILRTSAVRGGRVTRRDQGSRKLFFPFNHSDERNLQMLQAREMESVEKMSLIMNGRGQKR